MPKFQSHWFRIDSDSDPRVAAHGPPRLARHPAREFKVNADVDSENDSKVDAKSDRREYALTTSGSWGPEVRKIRPRCSGAIQDGQIHPVGTPDSKICSKTEPVPNLLENIPDASRKGLAGDGRATDARRAGDRRATGGRMTREVFCDQGGREGMMPLQALG